MITIVFNMKNLPLTYINFQSESNKIKKPIKSLKQQFSSRN